MKNFEIKDLQQLSEIEILSEREVKGKAFQIIKDRCEAVDDELSNEFSQYVKKGFENYTLENAIELLNMWEYEITEVQI